MAADAPRAAEGTSFEVLAPLADRIRTTLAQNPVRLGVPTDVDDLVSALTVHVAAFIGSILPAGGPHTEVLLQYAEQFAVPCPGHPLGAVVYLRRDTHSGRLAIFDGEQDAWYEGAWHPYEELTDAEIWSITSTAEGLDQAFVAGKAATHRFIRRHFPS
ncbi:hypothetical protein ACWEQ8_27605 [Streptomyces noursei]